MRRDQNVCSFINWGEGGVLLAHPDEKSDSYQLFQDDLVKGGAHFLSDTSRDIYLLSSGAGSLGIAVFF